MIAIRRLELNVDILPYSNRPLDPKQPQAYMCISVHILLGKINPNISYYLKIKKTVKMRVIWLSQAMLCLTYDQKPIVLRVDNYVYKTTAKKTRRTK